MFWKTDLARQQCFPQVMPPCATKTLSNWRIWLERSHLCIVKYQVVSGKDEVINPFHATDLFLYPLQKSVIFWFSDVCRGYRKRTMAWNELKNETVWQSKNKEKGESQNRGNKKTKFAKFYEKRLFLTPWYTHVFSLFSPFCFITDELNVCRPLKKFA